MEMKNRGRGKQLFHVYRENDHKNGEYMCALVVILCNCCMSYMSYIDASDRLKTYEYYN